MKYNIKIEVIENYMIENKISKTKFCKLCKISIRTLNKIMTNNDDFRIIALFKIAKVIKVQVNQMFD